LYINWQQWLCWHHKIPIHVYIHVHLIAISHNTVQYYNDYKQLPVAICEVVGFFNTWMNDILYACKICIHTYMCNAPANNLNTQEVSLHSYVLTVIYTDMHIFVVNYQYNFCAWLYKSLSYHIYIFKNTYGTWCKFTC